VKSSSLLWLLCCDLPVSLLSLAGANVNFAIALDLLHVPDTRTQPTEPNSRRSPVTFVIFIFSKLLRESSTLTVSSATRLPHREQSASC
jgi:hypothetical protein